MNSSNSENRRPNDDYDSAVREAERRLLSVTQGPTVDVDRLRSSSEQQSQFQTLQNDESESLLDTEQERNRSTGNLRDINAMSIASIYDREHNEVDDADK